ncbi:MAG TPA: phosphoribosyltransferase family protein [Candidatus Saccharimonadales bacterium]|nr:phosphoribosyltransferase family protein [Candidatus Saccharimonadales bacterium]
MQFIPINWKKVEKDAITLARQLKSEKIDEIISISRGGMVVARLLSDLLDLPISHITIESYSDLKQGKEPIVSQVSPREFKGERVLLVDELADSGKTFIKALEYLNTLPLSSVVTTALYIKPQTKYVPDYFVETLDGWLIMPYEIRETKIAFIHEFGEKQAQKMMKELHLTDWEK